MVWACAGYMTSIKYMEKMQMIPKTSCHDGFSIKEIIDFITQDLPAALGHSTLLDHINPEELLDNLKLVCSNKIGPQIQADKIV